MKFRKLNEKEIDCRISTVSEKGLSLLLYKDARVDMRILDETVGAENWTRKHDLINGNLFCSVGIYIAERNEWVYKQDVGTESYTEKEKGQASDSFKRACFNWGIGRELYSAPFIWVSADKCNIFNRNGKASCNDSFEVTEIEYDARDDICRLSVKNCKTGKEVYSFGKKPAGKREKPAPAKEKPAPKANPNQDIINDIVELMRFKGYPVTQRAMEQLEDMDAEALKAYRVRLDTLPNKEGN